jgi:TFIIF-interacting CTD phosphatase-like protein
MRKPINVILDLDQTLISSEIKDDFDINKFGTKMKEFYHKDLDDTYIVFARPYLEGFLDYLFDNFNVSVWTAASKSYALFIIEKFILTKPERKLDFVFFSYHCTMSIRSKKGLKGLNMLWDVFKIKGYRPDNTIIIDDNYDVKKIQRCNCFQIKPFNFYDENSEGDKELIKTTIKLEKLRTGYPCLTDLMV